MNHVKINGANFQKILNFLDNEDILLILTIGNAWLNRLQIQKVAFLLSKLLRIKIDVEPYKFGPFTESLLEKLEFPANRRFIKKYESKYGLTDEGKRVYFFLIDRLKAQGREDVVKILDMLRKMSDEDLLALTYYLFPEYAIESEIKKRVEKRIKTLRNVLKITVTRKKDDTIIIEIPEDKVSK